MIELARVSSCLFLVPLPDAPARTLVTFWFVVSRFSVSSYQETNQLRPDNNRTYIISESAPEIHVNYPDGTSTNFGDLKFLNSPSRVETSSCTKTNAHTQRYSHAHARTHTQSRFSTPGTRTQAHTLSSPRTVTSVPLIFKQ